MKKGILSIGLAALLAASLIACAGTPVDPPIQSDASSSQTETQAATAHTTEQTQTTAVTDCTEPVGTESAEQCQCPAESTQASTAQSTQASAAESDAGPWTDPKTFNATETYTRITDENGHCLSVVTSDRAENIELWKTPDDPAIRLDIEENRDGTVFFTYFTDAEGWRLDWVDGADGTLLYRYDPEGYCGIYPTQYAGSSDKAKGELGVTVDNRNLHVNLTREADGSLSASQTLSEIWSFAEYKADEWNMATRRFPVKTLPLTDKDTVPETPKYQTMAFEYPLAWEDEEHAGADDLFWKGGIYASYPRFMAEDYIPKPDDWREALKTAEAVPYLRMQNVGRLYYSEQPLPAPSFETLITYFDDMCRELIDMDGIVDYGGFSVPEMLQYLHDSGFPAFERLEIAEEDIYTLSFGNRVISIRRVDEHHYDCVVMRHYWLDASISVYGRYQDAMLFNSWRMHAYY